MQFKKRHDLIPMLVKAVQGYAFHERALLETITTLRSLIWGQWRLVNHFLQLPSTSYHTLTR